MLQLPCIIVEAEEQGADRGAVRVLVPAKAGNHAIALALVLHLEHDSLVRLVGP